MANDLVESNEEPVHQVVPRNDKGQFVQGYSGNPAGRAVGLRNKSTAIKEFIEHANTQQLQDAAEDIMNTAIRMAKGGDKAMIKLLLGDMLHHVRGEESEDKSKSKDININISLMTEPATREVNGEVIDQEET